jgi:hypothetical protein
MKTWKKFTTKQLENKLKVWKVSVKNCPSYIVEKYEMIIKQVETELKSR